MDNTERNMNIVVDDAKKETQLFDSFVTYRILTTIYKPNSQKEIHEVRRRYNDFDWLHSKLLETLPGCILPPLPDKNTLHLDRFDRDLIASRQVAFEKFLRRAAQHPHMRLAHDFRVFLTAKTWELDSYKKAHPSGNTLISKMTAQMKFFSERAASVQLSRTSGITFTERQPTVYADRLGRFSELVCSSKNHLHDLVTQLNIAATEEQALANDQAELASHYTQCSNNEDTTRPALLACANALNSSSKHFTDCVDTLRTGAIADFHEYENYTEGAKLVLRNIEDLDLEHKRIVSQIERGNLSSRKHEQLEEEAARTKQKMESIVEELQVDMRRWTTERDADLRDVFIALADAHIRQCEANIAEWEATIQPIQHISEPQPTNGNSGSLSAK